MAQTKVKLISDGVIVQGNLHSSHGITTAHIGEGSNLYYTDARVDTRVGNLNTGNLPEGSNLYYTDARADARVALIVDSSPATLNTLNELAAALGDDPNFATTTATSIGTKLPLAGGTMTGNVLIGNTVTNPASGFADQTGIGLKYSTTVPEIQISSDSTALQLGRTSTGGDGQIMALRYASNTIHSFNTNSFSVGTSATFAGTVLFNDHTTHPDQVSSAFGTGNDATIQHTGSHLFIDNSVGSTYIRNTSTSDIILRNSTSGDIQFDNEIAGNILFNTSNIERMRIDSSGNVKLAITNATSSTTIGKDASGMWMETAGSTDALSDMRFQARASGAGSYSSIKIKPSNQSLEFQTSGTVRMLVNSAGNAQILGIGNKNKGNLQLGPQTTGSKWSVLTGSHYNATSGSGNGSGSAGVMMIGVNAENGENHLVIGGAIYEANAATAIQFWTHTTDTSTAGGAERMRIDSSGYISTPADKRISVGAWDNSGLTSGAAFGFSVQSTSPGLFLKETDQTNRKGFLAIHGGGMYVGGHIDFFAIDVANGNRALTINDSLNVGIGTTSPDYKLEVEGASGTAISIKTPWAGGAYGQLRFQTGTGNSSIRSSVPGNSTNGLDFYTYSGGESLKMSITGAGNIQVRNGTTIGGELKLTGTDNDFTLNGKRGQIVFQIAGTNKMVLDANQLYPDVDNTTKLGLAGQRWSIVYAVSGVNTSDETLKENIKECDLGIDFIDSLKPKSYNLKDLKEDNDAYGKKRYGLIAQDLLETELKDSVFGKKDGEYGLSYNDLIAPMIKAIQELKADNDSLKARIETLENN